MSLSIAEIENNLEEVFNQFNKEEFIYDFVLSFGVPNTTIKRLKLGKLNLADNAGELAWKKKVFFKETTIDGSLFDAIDSLKNEERIKKGAYRFVILTNYKQWVAVDMVTADTLDCDFEELKKHFDFFLPLAGIEKAQYLAENPADVKAAEKMAKLYDQINTDNDFKTEDEIHSLNVFLSRLLFCFFAEDTGIFNDQQFTNAIESSTNLDASDIQEYLTDLFEILSLPEKERPSKQVYLHQFPYVNGGLFTDPIPVPKISIRARKLILDCGRLDWKAINPDIFGSMIQAVVTTDKRGGLGMHYTSVPNIMKVINPLFLDDLKSVFTEIFHKRELMDLNNAKKSEIEKLCKEFNSLLGRLQRIKIFDPACGSGNFLIIAYRELRLLEIDILNELAELSGKVGTGTFDLGNEYTSVISLNNFYGIEIDDFAHEVARLSLWLAEHQLNQFFHTQFGYSKPALPLKDAGHIVHANACRIDWEEVCPKKEGDEIYILGNPPYLGAKELSRTQKGDVDKILGIIGVSKRVDYIACWFVTAAKYIRDTNYQYSFVSTDSICQGEQVEMLWPYLISLELDISFAYQSFKWSNNAKNSAGITVVIIGIKTKRFVKNKRLFSKGNSSIVSNITPYLIASNNVIIKQRTTPISLSSKMILGSSGFDGGNLLLTEKEKELLLINNSQAKNFIRQFLSGEDFLNGKLRYCLWIEDNQLDLANSIDFIKERIQKCYDYRIKAGRDAKKAANVPHRFFYRTYVNEEKIIFPKTTSSRRDYVPVGVLDALAIPSNASFVINGTDMCLLSQLSSRFHNIWLGITSARMNTSYRYSVNLTYNTFPFPKITKAKEQELEECAYHILEVRERYPQKTLAQLYDPEKMPADLREAHRLNDMAVESCYREKPFTSDEERLEHLFKLYEKMIKEEKTKK